MLSRQLDTAMAKLSITPSDSLWVSTKGYLRWVTPGGDAGYGKLRVSFDIEDDYALKPVSETFFSIADTPLGRWGEFQIQAFAGVKSRRSLQNFGDEKSDLFESIPGTEPPVLLIRTMSPSLPKFSFLYLTNTQR
jgi:hypothetical protein